MKYNFKEVEKRWQKLWLEKEAFKADDSSKKLKYYQLETFPYPSAAGLHVGHPKGYIAEDIHARYMRMRGREVLYTMGWDAFGLPTENYAIKVGKSPKQVAAENIENFRRQVRMFGFSYDWDREINTSSPDYYKWTQWIFIKLFEKGLAYRAKARVNWCPTDQTVLANEQVIDGKCERDGSIVEQREMEQWFLKITDYAERLLADLKGLDWPSATIKRQEDWIGKSEGAMLNFMLDFKKNSADNDRRGLDGKPAHLTVFTTRPDTLYGATYLVLAPEHLWVTLATDDQNDVLLNKDEVKAYVEAAKRKTELQRMKEDKDPSTGSGQAKTGVELKGVKAINPATKEEIPIWVADYVLGSYGTGAIMAVPAHDERDFAFAKKFGLPMKYVVIPERIDHKNPHVPGKETVFRKVILGIVRNPKTGKYLCLNWKKQPWTTFVIGGIEGDEDPVEAARREITEETGYKNIKFLRILGGPVQSKFFAAHKDVNRIAHTWSVLFELENEEHEKISKEEAEIHEIVWLDPSEITRERMAHAELDIVLDRIQNGEKAYIGEGILTNSGKFDGLDSEKARWEITKFVGGTKKVQYKLRDWSVSRQRYWGVPIPMIHCEKCGIVAVPEKDLPVLLPDLEDYRPKGKPPLASSEKFINVQCPKCNGEAKRDPETLDTFVDSSWYYLRYTNPRNSEAIFDKEKAAHWLPVDLYVIGAEHTVLHLLYSRFIAKFLHDIGYVNFAEPFLKLRHQGLIMGEGGQKMSKSKGNVVNPDELINEFGADVTRLYMMFMGPFEDSAPWDSKGILGTERFLKRAWGLITDDKRPTTNNSEAVTRLFHKTIKKVTEDIESLKFNTAVSALMILLNVIEKESALSVVSRELFVKLLHPFAPHMAQGLWSSLGRESFLDFEPWPAFDPKFIHDETFTLVIQVNGKVRDSVEAPAGMSENEARTLALGREKIKALVGSAAPKKIIYVSGKLVNIVL